MSEVKKIATRDSYGNALAQLGTEHPEVEIWGLDSTTDERTVDVHVNRLRERFKNCDDFIIMTVRGLGYKAVKTEA